MRGSWLALPTILLVLVAAPIAIAKTFVDDDRKVAVDPDRGVDPRVDYESLLRFGPWDDRNYELTLEGLELLSPNEHELRDPVPAFFRVGMREAWPELRRNGPAQYPRSALQIFRQMFGGYLVNGKLYRKLAREDDRFLIVLQDGVERSRTEEDGTDFLSGDVRVSSPVGAAESAIAINPADATRVIAGSNGPTCGQCMHYSTDGGQNWTQVGLPLGGTCCDPAVDWSHDGTFAYTTALGGCGFFGCAVWLYRSDDGGQTWNSLEDVTSGDPRREIVTGNADKEFLHVDKHPSSPYVDNVYVTWHEGNVMHFAVSTDDGHSFATQDFGGASANVGIGSDIATGPNGEIYYLWPGFVSRTIRLRKSTDGGLSFASPVVVSSTDASFAFPIPSIEVREAFVYVAAGVDLSGGPFHGNVYVAWTDSVGTTTSNPASNHARVRVARSDDGGSTWSVNEPHETDDMTEIDRWHPWLAVGPDGSVHVVYYDTRNSVNRTGVDLYYSFSTDGAVTWSAPSRVTEELSPNISDSFEFGDYNGLDIVLDDLIAIYTDNRDETGEGGYSPDVYASGIAPGNGGGSGAGRITQPLLVDKNGADLDLSWSAACVAADDYAVYEGLLGDPDSMVQSQCGTGGTSTTLTPSAGNRFYIVVPITAGVEGSYGLKTGGIERDPAADACADRQIESCPQGENE